MNINTIDLEEISINDAIGTYGGGVPWGPILDYLARTAAGVLVGYMAHRALATPEYEGGELDPAYCYG